jgi:RNA polymerase sigma factor (sigma-70 family)
MADASDVVQTTWLRLVEHLGRLQEPERVGAWLATTARREALRALRHSSRQVPTEELPETPTETHLGAALLEAERDRALWQAFGGLSERCQTLLRILVTDPPPSYEEISAALDMPIGSIGPTRARCLERLRGLAEGEGVTATDRRELE